MKVGVTLPIGDHTPGSAPAPYPTIRAMAQRADAIGLDSVWVFDHLLFRFAGRPDAGPHEAWTILAALAEATDRVELGTLVAGMRFRNPGLLAKMAATLDHVSDGRLILGVGAGWHDAELEAFGYPTDHRVGRFEEALAILVSLIRNGTADLEGRWACARAATLIPLARPDIPVLVAARAPRMMRAIARHADASNIAWFANADDPILAKRSAMLDEACRAEGRDPASLVRTVGVSIRLPGATGPGPGRDPARSLAAITADPDGALRGFAEAGFAHAIVWLEPMNERSLERLGVAAALLRASAS
jgi:alkanesulfonate monooxygenase SsuD/methylene tetrahydromethanopterin reductase-like flavin-dependent oxidoreductase (luciferase family)